MTWGESGMKVAVISKADKFGGGASKVAEELTAQLNVAGCTAHHFVCVTKDKAYPNRKLAYGPLYWVFKKGYTVLRKLGLAEIFPVELLTLFPQLLRGGYDVLHFHDLSSTMSPLTLWALSLKWPVVWTVHDCSPVTGGCLYPMGCEKFKEACYSCPQQGTWPIDSVVDTTRLSRAVKYWVHRCGRINLVSPSDWMADLVYSSGMVKVRPTVLYNGVDVEVFQAIEKSEARNALGLPESRLIVLISAGNLLDERKGTEYSLEVIDRLSDFQPLLLLVGNLSESEEPRFAEYDYRVSGYISEERELNLLYASADLFLFCSLADNQPLSILETMASGTPTAGFQTGGMPEMIEQRSSGYLAPQRDVEGLTKNLREALNDGMLRSWGVAGRRRVEEQYSYHHFSRRHIEHYRSLLS